MLVASTSVDRLQLHCSRRQLFALARFKCHVGWGASSLQVSAQLPAGSLVVPKGALPAAGPAQVVVRGPAPQAGASGLAVRE
jgi:hypothetical protein